MSGFSHVSIIFAVLIFTHVFHRRFQDFREGGTPPPNFTQGWVMNCHPAPETAYDVFPTLCHVQPRSVLRKFLGNCLNTAWIKMTFVLEILIDRKIWFIIFTQSCTCTAMLQKIYLLLCLG